MKNEELHRYKIAFDRGNALQASKAEVFLELPDGTFVKLPNVTSVQVLHQAGRVCTATIIVNGAYTTDEACEGRERIVKEESHRL